MRLYSGKVSTLSAELVKALVSAQAIEVVEQQEVVRDFESVFQNYLGLERDVNERAREMSQSRTSEYGRIRKMLADQKGIKVGDDMLDFLLDQLIEMLMHSNNVEEVFAQDHELRKAMRTILRPHLDVEDTLDAEVRGQLKHVQEGSRTWEVEYQRLMRDIQRRKGLV
jgi:hypothetical protein